MMHKTISISDPEFWQKFNIRHVVLQSEGKVKTKEQFIKLLFDNYFKDDSSETPSETPNEK